ncbi:DUF58 domain-containing protein [Actinophytocola oryzae]|uniref:Uncharacterized protein (DUF58 family) n=1 Tax=Actinophytocola oryzae TaxID=502181 RepID=A0A4R7V6J2_9PSEU|nr:DUF58 domain-containing protein [Actinophytocola oryzae]TDV43166.1 uncharacterized protein (DUF58 family) [Actinophytocola oryzae]
MITRAGAGVVGAAAVLLPAGMWADYPELVMLGLACVAALLVGVVWLLARPSLAATREISPNRVAAGTSAYGVLTVTNTGRRRSPPSLVVEAVAGRRLAVPLPSLAAGAGFGTVYPLPADRRGRYVIPPPAVGHADPLRLFTVERRQGGESVLYVHPAVHPIASMPLGGPRDLEGPTSVSSPQGGVAFHSLRDYLPGDDCRRIHWKSTARTGTLMVRNNVVPDEPRHLVVLDTSVAPYDDDTFEEAVQVAASMCVAAGHAGHPVACRTTGDVPDETGSPWDSRVSPALDLLSGAVRTPGDPGLPALADLVRDVVAAGEGAALTVVTGRAEPRHLEPLAAMRADFPTVSVVRLGATTGSSVLSGVLTVDARTSTEFAVRWNQLFPR